MTVTFASARPEVPVTSFVTSRLRQRDCEGKQGITPSCAQGELVLRYSFSITTSQSGLIMKTVKLIIACIVLMLVPIAAAQASTGTMTRAAIDPTRTIAVITGSVTSPPGSTVVIDEGQPSLVHLQSGRLEVQRSEHQASHKWHYDGFFSFDRSIALLAPGMVDLRLCITVVQQFDEQDPVCVAQAPDPATCPLISRIVSEVVATTLFTVQPQPTFTPPSGCRRTRRRSSRCPRSFRCRS